MRFDGRRMQTFFDRLRGRSIENSLDEIARRGQALASLDDAGLRSLARSLREAWDVVEAYALAREAARRALGLYPYDVQLLAALALDRGSVVEMRTGEGKTLAAVLPAYLHALAGRGVHVLTFNDYLARRDAEWMGPVYRFLGMEARHVEERMTAQERRHAYAADVTYVTAKEAGFDFLRDAIVDDPARLVHRPFHSAIVDEADSLMIDEARVPLVLAGCLGAGTGDGHGMTELVRSLEPGRDFVTDEYDRNVELTDRGLDRAERWLGCGSLLVGENLALLNQVHCALHAQLLLHRDVDYIVRDGKVLLVDELTGRVVEDRHWPDGLQSAIEAKERLRRRPDGRTLGTITLQDFLRLYPRLCGMTGTARSAEEELRQFYGLEVVVIPTNRPCVRTDLPDVVFTHKNAKLRALVDEIRQVHATRRPILVGTASVAESEQLASSLRRTGVCCRILNAKTDEREAAIIAEAGAPGAVTISTNMAGRGTDIRLGGADESRRAEVVAAGGLYVIGTNRHESLRIDRQLRGRSGRQGDPGSSRFFISLEDDLIVRFGIERLIPSKLFPPLQDEPLDSGVIRREIARAQRIVEGQNFDIRRSLRRYSAQIERARASLHRRRSDLLRGECREGRLAELDGQCHRALCRLLGEDAVRSAERRVSLFHIDRLWSEYLVEMGDLREGIHLVRLGGLDPLIEFGRRAAETFRDLQHRIDDAVVATFRKALAEGTDRGLKGQDLLGPSSTWTYAVNDDPFRDQLGVQLTGAGNFGVAAGAALLTTAGPILVAWGLYNRFVRRRREIMPPTAPPCRGAWTKEVPMSRVADILAGKGSDVLTVPKTTTVYDTIAKMVEANVGSAIVTDDDGVCGIFTERDYLRRIVLEGRTSRETRVMEVMTERLVVVDPAREVADCMSLMTTQRIRHLPVMEGTRLVGILSIGDVVRTLSSEREAEVRYLTDYISGKYPG